MVVLYRYVAEPVHGGLHRHSSPCVACTLGCLLVFRRLKYGLYQNDRSMNVMRPAAMSTRASFPVIYIVADLLPDRSIICYKVCPRNSLYPLHG